MAKTLLVDSRAREQGAMVLRIVAIICVLVLIAIIYFWVVLHWNYSTGERAGWVQKLSQKGWICKTWEGELSMVAMPGSTPEKFVFTVRDDTVAENINRLMGKRVAMHYEEKIGLPTSCFGETRYYITKVMPVEELPLGVPGVAVPPPAAPPAAPSTSEQK